MSNVLQFAPNAQALENIPHMLRYWADMIERDQSAGTEYELAALVIVVKSDPKPAFFISGSLENPHHPLYVSGVFDYCRLQMVAVVDREDE